MFVEKVIIKTTLTWQPFVNVVEDVEIFFSSVKKKWEKASKGQKRKKKRKK